MTSSNAQARNTKHILLNNLGSQHSLVLKFGNESLHNITKEKVLSENFNFQRILCKKESKEVCKLI